MQVAADRPQKIRATGEGAVLLRIEPAAREQFVGLADAVDIFRDPEQRVQVAKAAFAVLDVGFDQIARLSGAAMTFFALGELGGHELGGIALYDFPVETRYQLVIKRLVPGEETGFENRGTDRHVAARLTDRFIDRARRMTDLQPHVPQAVEDGFSDLLAPGGLLVRQDK